MRKLCGHYYKLSPAPQETDATTNNEKAGVPMESGRLRLRNHNVSSPRSGLVLEVLQQMCRAVRRFRPQRPSQQFGHGPRLALPRIRLLCHRRFFRWRRSTLAGASSPIAYLDEDDEAGQLRRRIASRSRHDLRLLGLNPVRPVCQRPSTKANPGRG